MVLAGAPSVDKENVEPIGVKRAGVSGSDRTALVSAALRKGCPADQLDALFEHDARRTVHLPPASAMRQQLTWLEEDSAELENSSYVKLRLWSALAAFAERRSVPACARLVFERMVALGIAKYYKELYESWGAFEMRAGNADSARRALQLAVHNKVVEAARAEDVLKGWADSLAKERAAEEGDVTIALAGGAGAALSTAGSEPTVVLGAAAGGAAKAASGAAAPVAPPAPAAKRLATSSKKVTIRLPAAPASKMAKLGRAQRVVVSGSGEGAAEERSPAEEPGSTDATAELPTISEGACEAATPSSTLEPAKDKHSLKARVGDLRYIKNWTPGQSLAEAAASTAALATPAAPASVASVSPPGSSSEGGDGPTETFRLDGGSGSSNPTISFKTPAAATGWHQGVSPAEDDVALTSTFHPQLAQRTGSRGRQLPSQQQQQQQLTQTVDLNDGGGQLRGQRSSASGAEGGVAPQESLHAFQQQLLSPKNLFVVNGRAYVRMSVVGRGGSSKVFKVLALGEGEPQVLALKRIKLQRTDRESLASFLNEISLLKRLRGNPNIIELVDSQVDVEGRVIYMVMEHGEIDLASVLQQQQQQRQRSSAAAAAGGHTAMVGQLSVNFVRLTWMNMLEAVHAIHEERIVHGDLKPANFLFVKGKLKLIDFGIAKAISNDTTNIMRDTQVGTLNYMSPESIIDTNSAAQGARPRIGAPGMRLKQGRASDIWSMGCILYQMVYSQTPFHDLKLIQKIHCISDPNYKIAFPELASPNPDLLDAMQSCLRFDPADRPPIVATAPGDKALLSHPFLNPQPQGTAGLPSTQQQQQQALVSVRRLVNDVLDNADELAGLRKSDPQQMEAAVGALAAKHGLREVHTPAAAAAAPPPAREPVRASAAALAAAASSKATAPGVNPLQQSILSGKAGLKPVGNSDSARFMRPRGSTPDKDVDMAAMLRKGLASKRDLLELHDHTLEAIDRSGDTWNFLAG